MIFLNIICAWIQRSHWSMISQKNLQIWFNTGIKTVSKNRILKRVKDYYDQYRHLRKQYNARINTPKFKNEMLIFQQKCYNLFRRCYNKCTFNKICSCDMKQSSLQMTFLNEQRSTKNWTTRYLNKNRIFNQNSKLNAVSDGIL